jgi:hypothetical protein
MGMGDIGWNFLSGAMGRFIIPNGLPFPVAFGGTIP